MQKEKGYVIFERYGKTYKIRDKYFFFSGRKNLYELSVCSFDNSYNNIFIDSSIGKITFKDCKFNFKNKAENVVVSLNMKSSYDCPIIFENTSFTNTKGPVSLVINANRNTVSIDNIKNNSGMIEIHDAYSADLSNLENTGLNIQTIEYINLLNYKMLNTDGEFDLKSYKVKTQNVFVETLNPINIFTYRFEYRDINLTSNNIRCGSDASECISKSSSNDIYTLTDDDLKKLKAIFKFESCLKGVQQIVNDEIKQKVKSNVKGYDNKTIDKLKQLKQKIKSIEDTREIVKENTVNDCEKKKIINYIKKRP